MELHTFTTTRALRFQYIWKRNIVSLIPKTKVGPLFYFDLVRGFGVHQKLAENENLQGYERLRLYSTVLRDSASNRSLHEAMAVHRQVIKNGIDPDLHLWNSLVNAYTKGGSFQYARQVFDQMPKRDVVSWTALIAGLVAEGYGKDGIGLYREMRKDGVRSNGIALVTALKACSMCLDLDFGTQLHAEACKLGVCVDIFVGSAIVNLYAKCGDMERAERVFVYVPVKNAVLWHTMLNGYVQMGVGDKVLKIFCGMRELDLKFSKFSLSTVLKSCAHLKNWRGGKVVHAVAVKIGFEIDEFLSCCLLDMYSKCGLVDNAIKVFGRMKDPNIVAWSVMINCLDKLGKSEAAAEKFCLMRHKDLKPNQHTFASIVAAATTLGNRLYCEGIHSCIVKHGFESDNFICNALVTMYMKISSVHNGWWVFKAMSFRNLASWNALLSGIPNSETCDQVPKIFSQMLVEGFKPDIYTFISILRSCSSFLNIVFGRQVHVHVVKNGLEDNNFVGTALISMYAKSRCLEDAILLFNRLTERDLSTWTVTIAGFAQNQQGEKAVQCFSQMQREGLKPNEFTLSSCFSGCSSLITLEPGRQLHSLANKSGLLSNIYVASALVELYVKHRCIEDAWTVFIGMASHNAISWNTIICGYSQHGQGKKALEAFRIMLDEGVPPDEVTFIGVLSACSHEGWIEEANKYFNSLSKVYGITPTIEHCACMVNALSRAAKFSEVATFIEEWKLTKNALIWETVLWACKLHGNVEFGVRAAEKLFELEPEIDYNYIVLSNIFAVREKWDDVARVRTLMSKQGIKKRPGCSWLVVDDNVHLFFAQDNSHPKIKEINLELQRLARF
ncbi:hypothetical protein JRO89_XS04G0213800 [Xanthoceras sorbifolium]|uniref:Pentatricopeptide repeat-containing protein n=1 Tax=Xanthoceras sorbifolium TaxID=99658 RepID=A0ABQ8I6A5_9ROSI|nr:hypothetical protein JRO89_XS04G0213800 [Xanthoceras sorbifolium]